MLSNECMHEFPHHTCSVSICGSWFAERERERGREKCGEFSKNTRGKTREKKRKNQLTATGLLPPHDDDCGDRNAQQRDPKTRPSHPSSFFAIQRALKSDDGPEVRNVRGYCFLGKTPPPFSKR